MTHSIKTQGYGEQSRTMRAKKSLGQNFLKSEAALRKIIEVGEIQTEDVILEIGPGRGVLTEKLLKYAGTVIAVEKDRELVEFLQNKFKKEISSCSLVLVHGDILKFELARQDLASYKVIANIPYNITGAILKKFLGGNQPPSAQGYGGAMPERMILMLQQEVAQRVVARGGKESLLSISVKAYGEPKLVMKVPKRYFSPQPKVDSAIISIKNISRKNFLPPLLVEEGVGSGDSRKLPPRPDLSRDTPPHKGGEGNIEARFWQIVKAGFAHKRKKLSSNLKNLVNPIGLASVGDKRAEDLSLADWLGLVKPESRLNKQD